MKRNRQWIRDLVLLLAILGALGWYFSRIYVVNTTAKLYDLSPDEMHTLLKRVVGQKDGAAAYRIAEYYRSSKKDVSRMFLWTRKASDMGDKDAQKMWNEWKDSVPAGGMTLSSVDASIDTK